MKSSNLSYIAPLFVFLFAVFSGFLIFRSAWFGADKHFSQLAQSFLENDLYLSPHNLPNGDYADYKGKQYLFFGPMPAIILTPFVAVWGKNFPQINLSIASLIIVFLSVFHLSKKLKFRTSESFWLANFFVFGTVLYFVSLVNTSAYVVQAVGTAFLILALLEYFTSRRWLVLGLLVAAAGATRITLFGAAVFFIMEIFRNRKKINFPNALICFLLPVIFSLGVLGVYNWRRFGSVFDSGYGRNVSVLDKDYYNYKLGFFSPIHIPANLYALFLMPPQPIKEDYFEFILKFPYFKANPFGMAIWITSPLFFYLIAARKEPYTSSALIAVGVLLTPSLLYWGIGAVQFGYRYSLDFLPFLFLILLSAFKRGLPDFAKFLIAAGIVFNCFYIASLWGDYPLLDMFKYLP